MPQHSRDGRRYHHGDLRPALLDAGLSHLTTAGLSDFSVAEVARRVGVSTASPYRHFANRDSFVAAVAARAAELLATSLADAAGAAGDDPEERLAAVAGAYATFLARYRVGIDTIFSPTLRAARDPDLAQAGRTVMSHFLDPAGALSAGSGLVLAEQIIALAHGYAVLDSDGFLTADRVTDEPTPDRVRRAAHALIGGTTEPTS